MKEEKPLLPYSKSSKSVLSPPSSSSTSSTFYGFKKKVAVIIVSIYLLYSLNRDYGNYKRRRQVGQDDTRKQSTGLGNSTSITSNASSTSTPQALKSDPTIAAQVEVSIKPIDDIADSVGIQLDVIVGDILEAVGEAKVEPVVGPKDEGIRVVETKQPGSTVLGLEADQVFKVAKTSFLSYQLELENFIRESFPLSDSNEDDPHSLINDMRRFFPLSTSITTDSTLKYPIIPEKIFQTAAHESDEESQADQVQSWKVHHSHFNFTFHDDQRANQWAHERFSLAAPTATTSEEEIEPKENDRGILGAWNRIAFPPVLRADFWRYLVVAVEGGTYADTDVSAIRPVWDWSKNPAGEDESTFFPASFVCGVEADVGDREDWKLWYPRPLEISQWTFASARGHPILIDALRRVVENTYSGVKLPVVEHTGPSVFTDSVMRYAGAKYGMTWGQFRGLGDEGWRYSEPQDHKWGDLKVLSITGFSPGVGNMGAKDVGDPAAMVSHGFAGSWKGTGHE